MTKNVEEIKKVLKNHDYRLDSLVKDVMKKFQLKKLCYQARIEKQQGYSTVELLKFMIMMPLMLIETVQAFYSCMHKDLFKMKKDTVYRMQNNENIPWRSLLCKVAKQFKAMTNPDNEIDPYSAFIVDDTSIKKKGLKIENISWMFDHVSRKTIAGFKNLLLACYDGKTTIPVDFTLHSEKKLEKKKRDIQYKKKDIDKSSFGSKRRKECKKSKIEMTIAMIKRAVKNGFKAKFVLVDSWFPSKDFILSIREIKNSAMHIICGIKKDKRKYAYEGSSLNAKALQKKILKKKKISRCRKWKTLYMEVVVHYQDIGDVKLFYTRFPFQKKWRLFLSTDTSLSFIKMMEIYNIRWTIEVLFKECKQCLNLEKCQSRDFDAHIACITRSYILYTMLAYYKRVTDYETLGGLFANIRDDMTEKTLAKRLWELFEALIDKIIEMMEKNDELDLKMFKLSPQFQTMKNMVESSFLENQMYELDSAP